MADGRKLGKGQFVEALHQREGYTREKANRVVNAFIQVIKNALRDGKDVELEGIGKLRIVELRTARRISANLTGPGKTIYVFSNHKKTVRLKATLKLESSNVG